MEWPKLDTEGEQKLVLDAAELLGLREIDLFRLAHRRWHGAAAGEKMLERQFADYMFNGAVPPWVRHLAREVAARDRLGTLNADALGASAYHRVQPAPKFGAAYVAGTLAFCLMAQAMIIAAHQAPPAAAGLDCGGGPGWRAIYGLARQLSDKPPPACPNPGQPKPGRR